MREEREKGEAAPRPELNKATTRRARAVSSFCCCFGKPVTSGVGRDGGGGEEGPRTAQEKQHKEDTAVVSEGQGKTKKGGQLYGPAMMT